MPRLQGMAAVHSQRRCGIILGYVNIAVKNLVNLVYTPMLLSFVGQADYGVYQSCSSFVFSLSLLSFGFSQAYVRFYEQRRVRGTGEGIRRLNGMYLVLYLVISAVALVVGLACAARADVIFSSGFTPGQVAIARVVMALLAGNIAVTLLDSVFNAFVVVHEEFRFQQTRQLATSLATPFVAYALLCSGMGVAGVAGAHLAVSVALLVLNASFCIRRLGMRFDLGHFDTMLLSSLVAFSTWIFANQICDLVNQNVPNVLLGALAGASTVAVFAVSVQVRSVFVSLSTTMSSIFVPKINQIVAESDDNIVLTQLMARVGRYQMMLFCWVYGGLALLGNFFIRAWAGEAFAEAYPLILVMALPLALPLTQNTGIEIQRAKNRHRARSIAMLLGAVGNVGITVAFAPTLGFWAPAAGYILSIALCNGVFMNWYYHCRIGLDMGFFWRRCLPVVGAGAVVTVVCVVVSRLVAPVDGWVPFVVWGALYTAQFGVAVYVMALGRGERARLRGRIPFLERGSR